MGSAITKTYARLPEFYGSTFCVNCGVHLPVGKDGEFIWENTKQRVGTRAPTEEMGWEPYVPEPLKDISEMLAKRDGRHRVKRVTVKLEMEGALKDGAELVIDAVEGTELFMNLNMRAGNRKVPQPDGSSKFEGTGELDYSLEIYRRKV